MAHLYQCQVSNTKVFRKGRGRGGEGEGEALLQKPSPPISTRLVRASRPSSRLPVSALGHVEDNPAGTDVCRQYCNDVPPASLRGGFGTSSGSSSCALER